MYAIVYLFAAYTLLACVVSPSFREKTNNRWKHTPRSRVVREIGAGIIGLLIVATIIYLIVSSGKSDNSNEVGPTSFLTLVAMT
jgi:hypothetical protein